MESKQLPVLTQPIDRMRSGFTALAFDANKPHPVEYTQRTFEKQAFENKMKHLESVYGSHAAIRMRMEKAILSQFQRLPGLKSEFAGLDTILGKDEGISFEDFLADPHMTPDLQRPVHNLMEEKLGLGAL